MWSGDRFFYGHDADNGALYRKNLVITDPVYLSLFRIWKVLQGEGSAIGKYLKGAETKPNEAIIPKEEFPNIPKSAFTPKY